MKAKPRSLNIGTSSKQTVSTRERTDDPPCIAWLRSELLLLSWKSDDKFIKWAWEAVLREFLEYCSTGNQSHFLSQPIHAWLETNFSNPYSITGSQMFFVVSAVVSRCQLFAVAIHTPTGVISYAVNHSTELEWNSDVQEIWGKETSNNKHNPELKEFVMHWPQMWKENLGMIVSDSLALALSSLAKPYRETFCVRPPITILLQSLLQPLSILPLLFKPVIFLLSFITRVLRGFRTFCRFLRPLGSRSCVSCSIAISNAVAVGHGIPRAGWLWRQLLTQEWLTFCVAVIVLLLVISQAKIDDWQKGEIKDS